MLFTDAVKQRLPVLGIIYHFQRQIFLHHPVKSLGNFVFISFIDCLISLIGIRCGDFCFSVKDRCIFGGKGVPCSNCGQFCDSTDISCMKFRNFDRFGALQYIKFIQFFLRLFTCIVKDIVSFDNAGSPLITPEQTFTREYLPRKGSTMVLNT